MHLSPEYMTEMMESIATYLPPEKKQDNKSQ